MTAQMNLADLKNVLGISGGPDDLDISVKGYMIKDKHTNPCANQNPKAK